MAGLRAGRQMVRVDDGQRGVVELDEHGSARIAYVDRGEKRVAGRREVWVDADPPPAPLRAEEKLEIALHADRALRAVEKHEPLKFWEKVRMSDEPYDSGLVMAILAYLSERDAIALDLFEAR